MSQENVDVVRQGLEAFNGGDLEAALAMYDTHAEIRTLLSGSVHGREALRQAISQREDTIGAIQFLPDEFIDLGETVVGVVRVTGARGRLSGVSESDFAADQQLAFAFTLKNALVVRQEMFPTKAEALEAVGLSE